MIYEQLTSMKCSVFKQPLCTSAPLAVPCTSNALAHPRVTSPLLCPTGRLWSMAFSSLDGPEEHSPPLLRRVSPSRFTARSLSPPASRLRISQACPTPALPLRLPHLRPRRLQQAARFPAPFQCPHQFRWRVDNSQTGSFRFTEVPAFVPRQFRGGQEKTSSFMKIPPSGAD